MPQRGKNIKQILPMCINGGGR